MSFDDSKEVTELYDEASFKFSQQPLTQEVQSFDYNVLTSKVKLFVQNKTSEIKSLIRRSAEDIIEIGQKLIEVKEQLGHGNFRAWLLCEFDWSVRTAARFMQVATQFKCANLANLNISVTALYILAQPSFPEKARRKALELAEKGEKITYTKAKAILSYYQESAKSNRISAKATEDDLLTPSQPCQFPQTHSRLEPKYEANSAAVSSSENIAIKESDYRLDQKTVERIDKFVKQYPEVGAELQPEPSNHIRVLNIECQNPKDVTNIAQTFELTFAGVRVNLEGSPEVLLVLFKQMQDNPEFTLKVLQQAELLAANSTRLV